MQGKVNVTLHNEKRSRHLVTIDQSNIVASLNYQAPTDNIFTTFNNMEVRTILCTTIAGNSEFNNAQGKYGGIS